MSFFKRTQRNDFLAGHGSEKRSYHTFFDKVCKDIIGPDFIKDPRSAAMFLQLAMERPHDMINEFIRDTGNRFKSINC